MTRVDMYVKVEGEPSDTEDEAVAGTYLVGVDEDLPPEDRVSAVLDCFHEHVGIACLDDFQIAVFDGAGGEVAEREGADSYKLGHRAVFMGSVEGIPGAFPTP